MLDQAKAGFAAAAIRATAPGCLTHDKSVSEHVDLLADRRIDLY